MTNNNSLPQETARIAAPVTEKVALGWTHTARFLTTASQLVHLPPNELPEIAFVGRSNAGKSTAINTLAQQKRLAFASKTPGRTQHINLFELGPKDAADTWFADLPGYGYAQVGRARVKEWTRLAEDYLRGRVLLRRVCLLIDARHGLKDSDEVTMKRLDEAAVSYQIVLTKADEPDAAALSTTAAVVAAAAAKHVAAHPEIFITSSRTGTGIDTLRSALAALAGPNQSRYSPRP